MFDFCVSPSVKPVKFGVLNPGDTFTEVMVSPEATIYMKTSSQPFLTNSVVNLKNGCCLFFRDDEEVFPVQTENIVIIGR